MERVMTSTTCSYPKEKQNHVFSMFLKHLRLNNDLSQEQLCIYLRQHSSLFYNLDTITVSRWERGVNIPSLAKQAEIVELYDRELTSLYSTDPQFLNECRTLVSIPKTESTRSTHPYYSNDAYEIKAIDINDNSFYLVLKMIMRYESNPSLILKPPLDSIYGLQNLKIAIATAFNGQIVGHALFIETSSQNIFELVNIKSDLKTLMSDLQKKTPDGMLVLSSAGATIELENSIMSTYINLFSNNKRLKYLCFSICDDIFIKKLQTAKLEAFKVRDIAEGDKKVSIHSFLLSRSELMANRFLLKLAVISPTHLANFITENDNG